jgi:hypothetical protein
MRILEYVADREIRRHVASHQRDEGKRGEGELGDRHRLGDGHQNAIPDARADERHYRLDQRQRQREHECVVADFRNHLP